MPRDAAEMAEATAAAVGVDYSGVDLVEDGEGGFSILEVNSMPAWSGLQTVCDTDIAGAVVRGFLSAVRGASIPRLVVA
jgi:ribosomal protein S6--L-glutamate ligase